MIYFIFEANSLVFFNKIKNNIKLSRLYVLNKIRTHPFHLFTNLLTIW